MSKGLGSGFVIILSLVALMRPAYAVEFAWEIRKGIVRSPETTPLGTPVCTDGATCSLSSRNIPLGEYEQLLDIKAQAAIPAAPPPFSNFRLGIFEFDIELELIGPTDRKRAVDISAVLEGSLFSKTESFGATLGGIASFESTVNVNNQTLLAESKIFQSEGRGSSASLRISETKNRRLVLSPGDVVALTGSHEVASNAYFLDRGIAGDPKGSSVADFSDQVTIDGKQVNRTLQLLATVVPPVMATWDGGDGNWTDTNWTFEPAAFTAVNFPNNNDTDIFDAAITSDSTTPFTVSLQNDIELNDLTVSQGEVSQTTGTLSVLNNALIGNASSDVGTFKQSGGTHTITDELLLGKLDGSRGTYELRHGTLTAERESIGSKGTGKFIQSGGMNNTTDLQVGDGPGSNGTYIMNGGKLSVKETELIGNAFGLNGAAIGEFTQDGGVHSVGKLLVLGFAGEGTYNLKGGELSSPEREIIGNFGKGTFNHLGGTNNVNTLTIGLENNDPGDAKYTLGGNGNLSANKEIIGESGGSGFDVFGKFIQNGGINTVVTDLVLGEDSDSNGNYELNDGSLSASIERIGREGVGTFTQSDGNNTFLNQLRIGQNPSSSGTYELRGGSLSRGPFAGGAELIGIGGTGTFTQSGGSNNASSITLGQREAGSGFYELGGGSLVTDRVIVGGSGTGRLSQTGGTNTVLDHLRIGQSEGGNGTYQLSGTGSLSAFDEEIGRNGTGIFIHERGNNEIENFLILGTTEQGNGTYELSGGSLSAKQETIGDSGTGKFIQSGESSNIVSGELTIGDRGSYSLSGGTLSAQNIINTGVFVYTGGNLSGPGDGSTNLTNDGFLRVIGEDLQIDGAVTNNRSVIVSGKKSKIEYTQTFINNGVYDSVKFQGTVSDSIFNDDLVIGDEGYLIGGRDDNFIIGGDLVSSSEQNKLWSTVFATLTFADMALHDFSLTGADFGNQTFNGFVNNFAWRRIALDEGSEINLIDANVTLTAALYVKELSFPEAIVQDIIQDIAAGAILELDFIRGNGLNIYYDKVLNPFLEGQTFALMNGGNLIGVPEPTTLVLFLTGLAGLGFVIRNGRRRFTKSPTSGKAGSVRFQIRMLESVG